MPALIHCETETAGLGAVPLKQCSFAPFGDARWKIENGEANTARCISPSTSPEARAILEKLLEKYAQHGTAQFVVPDILKVPPISERGNVMRLLVTLVARKSSGKR